MNTPVPITLETVRESALRYMKVIDFRIVERAYKVAEEAHKDQLRKTGDPYIQHPLHVALTLAGFQLDAATLAAAFLHDVAEDTPQTISNLRFRFGMQVANLVDGVTKLDTIEEGKGFFSYLFKRSKDSRQLSHQERRIESLRKMLIASSRDVRVVLIKLADRLHNMETLEGQDPQRQYDIAKETLEIYAPLAYRLGIGTIKGQLEDLAFPYVYPEEYKKVTSLLKREAADRERQVRRAKQIIHRILAKADIQAEIHARSKHAYSFWRKLERYDGDISQIYDIVACRIVVKSVDECYQALGLIHRRWKPFEGRVKDYIAYPKPNGYQSIHTTVRAVSDMPIEIQIRTKDMHEQAERGIAAHWHYSEQKGTLNYLRRQVSRASKQELSWVNELAKWQRQLQTTEDFDQVMRIDFFGDRIFAYTPKGDVIDLPIDATPIDFAYAIHSEIGNHLAGAKINGKMVRLQDPIHSGDTVELIVQKKATPKSDWLHETKTQHAKEHIRRAMRRANTSQH